MKNDNGSNKNGGSDEQSSSNESEQISPAEYLRVVKAHLMKGRHQEAYVFLQQAAVVYPEDPFILSYYGCLQALVDKKYRTGVETCKRAIVLLKKQSSSGEDVLYPVFYLNLGRAYVAAGKKHLAIEVFNRGLRYDNGNRDILQELRALGERKKAPVAFLDRSNPINKYIGKILRKSKKSS